MDLRSGGDRPFTVLSLFSGIGLLDAGVKLANPAARTCVYVEWEAYACQVLVARMQEGSLDQGVLWSDVSTFDGRPWRGLVDCIIGGFPCFTPDTLVLAEVGYVPIDTLRIGDRVLTHQGRWRAVTSVMHREAAATVVIRGQGIPDVRTTAEHPFYVRDRGRVWDNERRSYARTFADPAWVEAGKLGDSSFVGQVVPKEASGPVEDRPLAFWWLVGRYLADGWRVDRKSRGTGARKCPPARGRVVIVAGPGEDVEVARRIAAAGYHATPVIENNTTKFHIGHTDLYDFLAQFGRYAHGKLLPGWVFSLPVDSSRALLDGYRSGDGSDYRLKSGAIAGWRATTVSRALALSMSLLAQRAYGVAASVTSTAVPAKTTIQGRVVNQRQQYGLRVPDRNRSAIVEGDYAWRLVRSVTSASDRDSGASTPGSSARFNLDLSSLKTSRSSRTAASTSSSVTLPRSGSMRSGTCSPRPRWAPPTSASACSSSPATPIGWSTPAARDGRGASGESWSSQMSLPRDVELWYTPNVPNGGRSVPAATVVSKGQTATGKRQVGLESQTAHWPTPRTSPGLTEDLDLTLARMQGSRHRGTLEESVAQWPTPQARSMEGAGHTAGREGSPNLQTAAEQWPTASARDWKSGQASDEVFDRNSRPLNEVAERWLTPTAKDFTGRTYSYRDGDHDRPVPTLPGQAATWATPTATDSEGRGYAYSRGAHDKVILMLPGQAQSWPTPSASNPNDGEDPTTWLARAAVVEAKHHNGNGMGMPLAIAAKAWPTPTSADGERDSDVMPRGNPTLGGAAKSHSLHPDPPTWAPGDHCSPADPTSPPPSPQTRRLNPRFVELLMGAPVGWSEPWPTAVDGFMGSETGWYHSQRRWLSQFSGSDCTRRSDGKENTIRTIKPERDTDRHAS